MERRVCGQSDIEISVLGLGCWSFGSSEKDYWGPQDQSDVAAVVHKALDYGVNYFDTAEVYNAGRGEESLGKALKGRRHEAVVGSKVSPSNTAPSVLREHCEASLRRLQTDYIDIYMPHWATTDHPFEDVFATLTALKSEGKIRSIGVSNFGFQQLTEALATGVRIDVDQVCYNLLSRAIEVQILPLCRQHSIGILGYMPLLQGWLAGRFRTADEAPPKHARFRHFRGDRLESRHGESGAEEETFEVIAGIREVAQEMEIPMAQLALAWAMARPGITSILVGCRNVSELQENVGSTSICLSPETIKRLDDLTEPLLNALGSNADYFRANAVH